jgi:hypothetical protein
MHLQSLAWAEIQHFANEKEATSVPLTSSYLVTLGLLSQINRQLRRQAQTHDALHQFVTTCYFSTEKPPHVFWPTHESIVFTDTPYAIHE